MRSALRVGQSLPDGEQYSRGTAIEAFRKAFWVNELPLTPESARTELAKYDFLSCWRRLDGECHVDEYIGATHCEHRPRDVDGRCCLVCRACLHRDITIERSRATCRDYKRTFIV